jgi:hypothetical protein
MDNEVHRELFGTYLHVHHVNYARLGAELDEDLEALCKRCHNAEETAEFDPTEYGDPLAIDLDVGIEHGTPVLTGIEFGVIDFASPPEVYWTRALERIDNARRAIANTKHTETAWNQLERFDGLEQLVRKCLELACPELVPVKVEESLSWDELDSSEQDVRGE